MLSRSWCCFGSVSGVHNVDLDTVVARMRMTWFPIFFWICAVMVAGCSHSKRTEPASGPQVLTWPRLIELGECKTGATLKAEFDVKNTGTEDLVLHSFKPSCACMVVSDVDNFAPIERPVLIPPGETRRFRTGLSTVGKSGDVRGVITLVTNVPAVPTVSIELNARVSAFAIPVPPVISATGLRVGEARLFSVSLKSAASNGTPTIERI